MPSLYELITLRTWWRHQMETFSALLALCVGNSPVTGGFPPQRQVTRSFDVFFDLRQKIKKIWVNNREAGVLRPHRAHYSVIIMTRPIFLTWINHDFLHHFREEFADNIAHVHDISTLNMHCCYSRLTHNCHMETWNYRVNPESFCICSKCHTKTQWVI